MSVFQSTAIAQSESFQQNRADMTALVDKLSELNARAPARSAKRKERFEARGQLLPRERLARLLDPGMPYFEIGNIAGYLLDTDQEEKSIPGSTIMSGIGFVAGVRCVIVNDDRRHQSRGHDGRRRVSIAAGAGNSAETKASFHSSGGKRRWRFNELHRRRIFARRHVIRKPCAAFKSRAAGHRHPTRIVHRRRRLYAGSFGLCDRRQRPRQSFSRGPPASESRNWRDCNGRRTRRRGNARQAFPALQNILPRMTAKRC